MGGRDQGGLGREDFQVDARLLRRGLLDNGCGELPIGSEHVVAIETLPPLHKYRFNRILIAQALVEGITLLTTDEAVSRDPVPADQRQHRSAIVSLERRLTATPDIRLPGKNSPLQPFAGHCLEATAGSTWQSSGPALDLPSIPVVPCDYQRSNREYVDGRDKPETSRRSQAANRAAGECCEQDTPCLYG